jgi:hypothetical protein
LRGKHGHLETPPRLEKKRCACEPVHFLIEQDSVRFNIDRDAAERVGLRIRSRMLDSAKRVIARRAIAKP